MRFLKTGSLFLMIGLLIGCNDAANAPTAASPSATPSATPVSPSPSPSTAASPTETEPALISATGIGEAQLGMTIGELKQKLGEDATFTVKSPFIVDFDAIVVQKDGEVQYYILGVAGQPFSDEDVIQGLFTDNPGFRTAEGIGVGSTIQAAERAYGKATLSYNTSNESREYARFQRQPAPNLSFSTGSGSSESAGIYASPTGEYNETQEFKPDATIKSILLICLTEDCASAPSQ